MKRSMITSRGTVTSEIRITQRANSCSVRISDVMATVIRKPHPQARISRGNLSPNVPI